MDTNNSITEYTFEKSKPFLRSWAFHIMSSGISENEISDALEEIGLLFSKGIYITVAVNFEQSKCNHIELFAQIHKCIIDKSIDCMPFFEPGMLTYVCSFSSGSRTGAVAQTIALAQNIKEQIDETGETAYGIGIGQEAESLYEIPLSCTTAEEACKYRYRLGERQVIYINDVEPKKKLGEYRLVHQDALTTAIKVGSEHMMIQNIERVFDDIEKQGGTINYAKRVCLEIIVCTVRAIYEIGQSPNMLFDKTDIWTVINRCETMKQLKDLLINTNKVVISQLFHKQVSKNRSIIEKAKRIITEDSDSKTTLESVAEKAFISPCYLSLIFGKETGMTFKEYLTQSRISKAKKLLLDHNHKVYEVSKMIGFADSRYFSDLFRKYEGITPTEYRKIHGK